MNAVFADTFFWIAFTNVQDQAHQSAKSFARSATPSTIFTTEEVLTEYLNYFAGWGMPLRERAALNVQSILANPTVRVIAQTSDSFHRGLTLYQGRLDKGYSLTDCISMQTMRTEGIVDVLTNDMHFEQERFRAVFRRYPRAR